MKNLKLILATLFVGGIWAFTSCQKSQNSAVQSNDITPASDEAFIDNQSSYVDAVVQAVTATPTSFVMDPITTAALLPSCATITTDTTGLLKTVTINYGSTPCKIPDGEEYRQGT